MKTFNGKAIYQPGGKAAEYSKWACNFYVGCSNNCDYCYCKKGILAPVMGMDKPQLKKCFRDEGHALKVFESELSTNIVELQKHGLFFSFTTDPMLPETIGLTKDAIDIAINYKVPVKILTKRSDWIQKHLTYFLIDKQYIAFGFTLTGHDELEPNANTNAERIEAMRKLHDAGFKTFASIEPIIDFDRSYDMMCDCAEFCDLFKIGLMSGKQYSKIELIEFVRTVVSSFPIVHNSDANFYFKDSLLKAAGISREGLPSNCVSRDFNLFQ